MWLKLDKSNATCIGINREIAYAYLTLKEYIKKEEKWAELSSKMKSHYSKRLYKSLKKSSKLNDEVRVYENPLIFVS